jgi:hypothetical protein
MRGQHQTHRRRPLWLSKTITDACTNWWRSNTGRCAQNAFCDGCHFLKLATAACENEPGAWDWPLWQIKSP